MVEKIVGKIRVVVEEADYRLLLQPHDLAC